MKVQVRYQYQIKGHPGGTITTRTVQVASKSLSALKDALSFWHNPAQYDIRILESKVVG